jgi:hypothetical protein
LKNSQSIATSPNIFTHTGCDQSRCRVVRLAPSEINACGSCSFERLRLEFVLKPRWRANTDDLATLLWIESNTSRPFLTAAMILEQNGQGIVGIGFGSCLRGTELKYFAKALQKYNVLPLLRNPLEPAANTIFDHLECSSTISDECPGSDQ